jgi:hypothetical protein
MESSFGIIVGKISIFWRRGKEKKANEKSLMLSIYNREERWIEWSE